jgi:hypothetical protein
MNAKAWLKLAQRTILVWLLANICLLVALFIRVKFLLPGVAVARCSGGVLLWDILPLFGMLWLSRRGKNPLANALTQLLVAAVSAFGTFTFFAVFCFCPNDGQSGLSLFILPFFQWLVLLTAFLFLERL